MKEILELRVNHDYAHLLFHEDEGQSIGTSVKVVEIPTDDLRLRKIPVIAAEVKKKYNRGFIFAWQIQRKYTSKELADAELFQFKIPTVFEPCGEECGTQYDESNACELCGANRKQIGPLRLKRNSIPKKDIAKTIAGEVVVSEKLAAVCDKFKMRGLSLVPVEIAKEVFPYYQLVSQEELELGDSTMAGIDPFDLSETSDGAAFSLGGEKITIAKEVYKCPRGHTIGLNVLSEAHVLRSQQLEQHDFFTSVQKVGVKRGFLRPQPLMFCSSAFREMVKNQKLSGFEFEIAHFHVR
jgi:ribosomal protein S14